MTWSLRLDSSISSLTIDQKNGAYYAVRLLASATISDPRRSRYGRS
jgi:hypothetical protein